MSPAPGILSLPPLQSGTIDAAIAGQSMTATRMAEVDMAGPYYYAHHRVRHHRRQRVRLRHPPLLSSPAAAATAQSGTIWYDTCLPQIPDAQIQSPRRHRPRHDHEPGERHGGLHLHRYAQRSGRRAKNSDLVILDFSGTEGDFQFATRRSGLRM